MSVDVSLPRANELPPLLVTDRLDRLRALLADAGCEALVVSTLTNVRWLTGFTGSAGRVVVTRDDCALVTDGRYGDQAAEQLRGAHAEARVVVERTVALQSERIGEIVRGVERVGLEAAGITWADQRALGSLWPNELVPTIGLVEGLRLVKDDAEVARIELACAIADRALANVLDLLDTGITEDAFGLALDTEMRRLGAQGPSFETIVASGPNAALPHHRPSSRTIVDGDTVILDFGALVDGYHSDMTRTAVVGDVVPELREAIEVVTAAQAAGVAAVRAGARAAEVDRVCRDAIAAAGLGDRFTHGTGHGVGLLIHEAPWLNATSEDLLPAGAVVTVEPGVYLLRSGGVRVEDSVLVTTDGCRTLTSTPKDLGCLRSPPTT